MNFQASGSRPPMLLKDSDFVKWTVDFMDFISRRENGDLMIKSFSEGPLVLYKREEDFSEEEIKRKKADKHALSYLLLALPQHIYKRVEAFKNNPMLLWSELTKFMHGSKVDFRAKKEKKAEEEDAKQKNSEIHKEDSSKVEREDDEEKKVEIENSEKMNELSRRLKEVKELLILERKDHKKEKADLVQRISDLEKKLKIKTKACEDNKAFELQFQRLSKQNSDFQKVLFLEKEKLEKERADFEVQRKGFEAKNAKLTEKTSELQKDLEKERQEIDKESQELEKMKKADFQARCVKDEFSKERKIFRQEIHKLTMNLAALSTDIMKEKRVKSNIQKKLDLVTKERNDLSYKVKSLNKSKRYSECPIRPSNLFYDTSVDNSSKFQSADLPTYKKVNMQWRVKGTSPRTELPKSSVHKKNTNLKAKSFANPDSFYSANHLIRLAQKNFCCSFCGTNDFVKNESIQYWYGTYHFPSYRAPLNKPGPKTRWVPKST